MRLFCSFALALGVAAAQTPTVSAVVNGMSYTPPLSPGSLAKILGRNLTNGKSANCQDYVSGGFLPWVCAGASVTFQGKPGAMYAAFPGELTVQIPVDAQIGKMDVVIQVKTDTQTLSSVAFPITLTQYAPGVATTNQIGTGPASAFNQDYQANMPWRPASFGDSVTIYATGLGPTDPSVATGANAPNKSPFAVVTAPVKVTVDGKSAAVQWAGLMLAGWAGIYEVSFVVPADTSRAGSVPLVLEVGGVVSQPNVTLAVAKPVPTISGVLNAASGSASIASGTWITVYGLHLSSTSRQWSAADFTGKTLPMVLDGVSVKVNGLPAAVYYISGTQVNVLSPADSTVGTAKVELTNSLGTASANTTLARYSPAFFTFSPENFRYVAAVHNDGVYVGKADLFAGAAAARPAQPGETILLFGNGFGPTIPPVRCDEVVAVPAPLADPGQLSVTIGGVTATVVFAGITVAGEYQFNVVVPDIPNGDQPVVATIAGVATQGYKFLSVRK